MALTCPHCGAENRDAAKFCLKCARQLVPLGPKADEPAARRGTRSTRPSLHTPHETPTRRGQRYAWLVALMGLLLAALAAAWMVLPQRAPVRTLAGDAAKVPALPAAAAASVPAAEPASAAAPPVLPQPESFPSAVAPPSPPAAPASAAARAETPARPRPAPRASAARPSNKPGGNEAAPALTAEPATPPRPAASAPAAPTAAGALCADRRFIAHAVCLQAECDKPAMRQHPQCLRMREQQDALRRGSGES